MRVFVYECGIDTLIDPSNDSEDKIQGVCTFDFFCLYLINLDP